MAFLSPKQLIEFLNIKPGSTVLDIGAGSGSYIYEICRVLGNNGMETTKLIAIDINDDKLKLIKDTAKIGGFKIETSRQDIENGIVAPDYSADYLILANVLFNIDKDKIPQVIKECKRVLSPYGSMLFVEWRKVSKLGPPESHIVEKDFVEKLLLENKMTVKRELEAGEYHYALLIENI